MIIIMNVDENGTREGDCDFREIELCEEDEQNLFVMIGHSIANNNKLERVEVLTEYEYQQLIKYRDSNPHFIKYKEAQDHVRRFEQEYDIR